MLKVNELFSGIGTQALALEYLGIPHEVVGMCEIEKNAIAAYNILHGDTYNYGNISEVECLDYADLWTYSFPCFTGNTPILTSNGFVNLQDIQVGMQVYTHTGSLQKVTNFYDNGFHPITKIKIDGISEIETTANHKFLVLQHGLLNWIPISEIEIGSYACILKSVGEVLNLKSELSKRIKKKNAVKRYSDIYIFKEITSITYTNDIKQVYDIEVDIDHSFVANGVIVHNCQDLSSAGKGKGISATDADGNHIATRSGLLWEVERLLAHSCGYDIIDGKLSKNASYVVNPPKYLLLENVPELIDRKKHMIHFQNWLDRLDALGYHTNYGKLNGGHFGVPQNRERVFCLSVRKDIYSDDIDFPSISVFNQPINGKFEDFVDKVVLDYKGPLMIDPKISDYLLPAYTRDLESIALESSDPLFGKDIWTCKCKSGFQDHRVGIKWAPTIRHQNQHTAIFVNNQIHKLTACECWKFMGIKEEDFWKVKTNSTISDNILCGLAGNAIVVPVLMSIFNQIWLIETTGSPLSGSNVPFLTINNAKV